MRGNAQWLNEDVLHILLIHQAFTSLDEPGGTRHYELARYLADQGHRVTVIASPVSYLTGKNSTLSPAGENQEPTPPSPVPFPLQGEGDRGDEMGSVTILRAYTYPALHRSFVHRMFSFVSFMASSFWIGLKVRSVDLVWGTSPPIFQGVTAWALARFKRVPFLFEVRDLWPAFAIQVGVLRNTLLVRASLWLERFLYRRADRLMVNSPGFIEHVHRRGARQVTLIPNGADPRMFDPQADGADFRSAHGLEGKFVILYDGAHGMSNDLGVVLEAAGLLRDRAEIAIVLLGDGKDKPALLRRALELSLPNVHFLASIPKTEMPAALAAANACLAILKPIPLYATVYPNKVFDYMAAGRAVILAIDGVLREVIESAGAGVFVPPGNPAALAEAMRALADDPSRAQAMGRQGRQHVEAHFDRVALAAQLEQLVQELAGPEND
jgi:glycosyltransferase involved in cell wall biosynthesis